jgi:hypothetical protein
MKTCMKEFDVARNESSLRSIHQIEDQVHELVGLQAKLTALVALCQLKMTNVSYASSLNFGLGC